MRARSRTSRSVVGSRASCWRRAALARGLHASAASPSSSPRSRRRRSRRPGRCSVGVDLAYPPFGGTDDGKQAGIDVDVASALAEQLGLTADVRRREAVRGGHRARRRARSTSSSRCRTTQESLSQRHARRLLHHRRPGVLHRHREHRVGRAVDDARHARRRSRSARRRSRAAFWMLQSEFGAESLVGVPDAARGAARRSRRARSASPRATRSSAPTSPATCPTVRFAGQLGPAVAARRRRRSRQRRRWATPCARRSTSSPPTACSTRSGRKWVGDAAQAQAAESSTRARRRGQRRRRSASRPSASHRPAAVRASSADLHTDGRAY